MPTGRFLGKVRASSRANMTESLVLTRSETPLAAQAARVSRPSGSFREGVFVQPPLNTITVMMAHDADAELGDEFPWGGKDWQITEHPILATDGTALTFTAEYRSG